MIKRVSKKKRTKQKINMKKLLPLLIVMGLLLNSCSNNTEPTLLELKTGQLKLDIGEKGSVIRLIYIETGKNYISEDTINPLMAVRINGDVLIPQSANVENEILTLNFGNNIDANIKIEEKESYLTFELLSITNKDSVDLILWGPYNTLISKIIGETVGIVRGEEFALGIQSLNIKTLGGYPWNESDRMPAFDIFTAEDPNNMHPQADGGVLYRVEAAKPTATGSSLQAYCRNRIKERIIQDFNHEKIVASAYQDGGVVGSRIALFGCPVEDALQTVSEIEVAEGLPHPMIDGVWGKLSPDAAAAYLITNFTENDVDKAIELTKKAGLKHLYHYGKTFENWGHFELFKGEFPNGIKGLKECVEKAEAQGVKVGIHFLSNFITTNDPYVTPIPDKRLAIVGGSEITHDISAEADEIPIQSPDFFNQMKNNSLKTVRIGDELIRYGAVSENSPWTLLDCQRGAFSTIASAHQSGEQIVKLLDHAYKVFLTNAELTIEMSERIADLYNKTGLRQISFDGLEGNRSTGLGTYGESLMPYVWYNSLSEGLKDHLIIDASRTTHFFWHIYTRMNWGEPWYGGFRESQTEYRFKNQAYFKRNFMPGMLGWFKMTPETSIEDAEWLLAKSAGYDAGYALVVSDGIIEKNGNSDKILELIGDWEKLRLTNSFTEEQKERMRNTDNEFSLNKVNESEWSLWQINSELYKHEKKEKQPGEPLHSTFEFNNDGEEQPLCFTLTAMGCDADNITLEIDSYKELKLPVGLKKGQSLKYQGGDVIVLYNASWQILGEYEIESSDLIIDKNDHSFSIDCDFTIKGENPNVKVELKTVSGKEKVTLK